MWKLLVPVDFCHGCTNAFNLALSLAKKQNSKIYLSHIISDPQIIDPLYASDIHQKMSFEEIKGKIEKEMGEVYIKKARGISEIDTLITKGYAASEIVESAKKIEADLIVMATHARKILKHAFIGSIAEKVLRTSPCPVLTTKLGNEINFDKFDVKNILVPVDFSEHSEKGFKLSVKLARLFNARIHILYVLQPISFYPYYYGEYFSSEGVIIKMEEEVKDRLESLIREKGEGYKDITYKIQIGEPFQDILEKGKSIKADLIVMGTHGRTGFSHLLMGSVAERVVRLAECPVLTVKGD